MAFPTRRTLVLGLVACALASTVPTPGGARGDGKGQSGREDHDRVHTERDRGNIEPLPNVLKQVWPSIEGEILEIEFEVEDGVPVYEIKFVGREGRVRELYVDARSGKILGTGGD